MDLYFTRKWRMRKYQNTFLTTVSLGCRFAKPPGGRLLHPVANCRKAFRSRRDISTSTSTSRRNPGLERDKILLKPFLLTWLSKSRIPFSTKHVLLWLDMGIIGDTNCPDTNTYSIAINKKMWIITISLQISLSISLFCNHTYYFLNKEKNSSFQLQNIWSYFTRK